jgi:AraC family transcriptional regulator, activator of mtrCDE
MDQATLEDLLTNVEVKLGAFAVCEIGADWRLRVGPMQSMICHFVARGHGFLEFGGKRVPIGRGAIVIVPPETPKSICGPAPVTREVSATDSCSEHSEGMLTFRATSARPALVIGCASITAHCGSSFGLLDGLAEPVVLSVEDNQLFAASFDALLEELTKPDIGSMIIAECLMKQALVLLLREQLKLGNGSPLLAPLGDHRLLRAASMMLRNPGAHHTTESLAEAAGMSRSSFMARFVQEHGRTPGEFLQGVRMQSAARLLRTSEMPVKCLAAAVGYASRSQFSRAFKQTFGMDPTSYRSRREEIVPGRRTGRTSGAGASPSGVAAFAHDGEAAFPAFAADAGAGVGACPDAR